MPSSTAGVVSVIIVNFRGADDTIEAVERLTEVDWPRERLDVVVVENGSGDDSLARLEARFGADDAVRVVASGENLGFTGGVNLGAEHARGEFLALLNSDAKPERGWIRAALEQFEVSPTVAAVGSKVLDWQGETIDFVGSGLTWFGMGYKTHVGEPDAGEHDSPRDILFATGAALFVRAEVFHEIGGLDDRFFMFYDDVDLGWHLTLLGYRVRFAPASVVRHKHHGSMSAFGGHRELYLLERNALFLLYKYLDDENLGKLLPAAMSLAARRASVRSGLDSESFDLRRFDPTAAGAAAAEAEATAPLAKDGLATLYALDQFVEQLDTLAVDRRRIQGARVRTDAEIFAMFGDAFQPMLGDERFLEGWAKVLGGFDVATVTRRNRILVITGDALGVKMAGPAMRAWRISEALSAEHDVRLVTWNVASRQSDAFEVSRVRLQNEREMRVHEQWADVIIVQGAVLRHFNCIADTEKILVCDIYDPLHLEQLEQGREFGTARWTRLVSDANAIMNEQLARGDFFVCASERQRMFWLGQLAGLGRINPANYAADDNLDRLIDIVPFGLGSTPPEHTRPAIRGVVDGIDADSKLLIWGGGIYNWFDTPSLVRAVAKLAPTHPDLKLFFMGVKHPNPDVPEMAIVAETRELARELGVYDSAVFFNETWVDLDDRQNYLLEADAGVSTHYQHVETTFSFRTRILDYLWAGLPIVTTEGDSFGDLVGRESLGVPVPERDVDALAAAIETVLYDAEAQATARENIARVRDSFTWERALAPLVEFCRDPYPAADRALAAREAAANGGGASGGARSKTKDKEQRLHEIETSRHGFKRDLALARHYLADGGIDGLAKRVKSRIEIRTRSKNG